MLKKETDLFLVIVIEFGSPFANAPAYAHECEPVKSSFLLHEREATLTETFCQDLQLGSAKDKQNR